MCIEDAFTRHVPRLSNRRRGCGEFVSALRAEANLLAVAAPTRMTWRQDAAARLGHIGAIAVTHPTPRGTDRKADISGFGRPHKRRDRVNRGCGVPPGSPVAMAQAECGVVAVVGADPASWRARRVSGRSSPSAPDKFATALCSAVSAAGRFPDRHGDSPS